MQLHQIVFTHVFPRAELHRIECGLDDAVLVVGDPDCAAYEWVITSGRDVLGHSNDAYGSPAVALRDGLNAYFAGPAR